MQSADYRRPACGSHRPARNVRLSRSESIPTPPCEPGVQSEQKRGGHRTAITVQYRLYSPYHGGGTASLEGRVDSLLPHIGLVGLEQLSAARPFNVLAADKVPIVVRAGNALPLRPQGPDPPAIP